MQCRLESCCSSVSKLCLTLCDPMNCSMPGFPVLHHLPEFAQTHVQLSQWCYPIISSSAALFSWPQSFPASGSFPVSRLLPSGGWSTGASASASVLPVNIQLITFRIDSFDLLAVQGTLRSLLQHYSSKASILQYSAFLIRRLKWMETQVGGS